MFQRFEFDTTDSPIHCFPIALERGEELNVLREREGEGKFPEGETSWQVFDANGIACPTIALPVVSPRDHSHLTITHVLVCFTPPLPPHTEGFQLIQRDFVLDSMSKLLRPRGSEHMSLESGRSVPAERCDVVLLYPSSFLTPQMRNAKPAKPVPGNVVEGRAMDPKELLPFRMFSEDGYEAIGWTGCNLKKGDYLGVEFYRDTSMPVDADEERMRAASELGSRPVPKTLGLAAGSDTDTPRLTASSDAKDDGEGSTPRGAVATRVERGGR